ncbi:hypothetical protein [Teichococcus aerofrigidensis]
MPRDVLSKDEIRSRSESTAREHGGILPMHVAFFAHSIAYSASRSEAAFQEFEILAEVEAPDATIFAGIQEALTHAAALSRFFFPTKPIENELAATRGKKLRELFNVEDGSPLKWRHLRNALEHFDEDLDRFLLSFPVGYLIPSPIVTSHTIADEDLANIFKLVDPVAKICVLLGKKFEYAPIRSEVQRVLALAKDT